MLAPYITVISFAVLAARRTHIVAMSALIAGGVGELSDKRRSLGSVPMGEGAVASLWAVNFDDGKVAVAVRDCLDHRARLATHPPSDWPAGTTLTVTRRMTPASSARTLLLAVGHQRPNWPAAGHRRPLPL